MSGSERLKEAIDYYFAKAGRNAAAKLSLAAECGPRLIYQIKNEGHVPRSAAAYRIAIACGWTEVDALKLSQEVSTPELSETV